MSYYVIIQSSKLVPSPPLSTPGSTEIAFSSRNQELRASFHTALADTSFAAFFLIAFNAIKREQECEIL